MEIDEYLDFGKITDHIFNDEDIDDDDIPDQIKCTEFHQVRYQKIGFIPQQEIFVNNFLPSANHIDNESQTNLVQLKDALAKAVALRNMTAAIGIATSKLYV